ncbi:zinc-ribbon domain-containing protein [Ruminococcus sp. JE7B6]|uniref:zinc-ribbon domain-containing protein n=1 Tax=Ruminococcus sp. JE7B6 TaxID=3233380 RepID=UPI00389A43E1
MKRMLADVCPELINEWSQRNLPLTPNSVTHGSNKIVWWKGKCGHEWRASVKNRVIGGSGCPYCSHNAILEGFNDLASQKPELAAEWSARNAPLLPTQVTVFANRKAWWKFLTVSRRTEQRVNPDEVQVITLDESKEEYIRNLFWEINKIDHRIETYTETEQVEEKQKDGKVKKVNKQVQKKALYITVSHVDLETIMTNKGFTAEQKKMCRQLLSDENNDLWRELLHGVTGSNSDIVLIAQEQLGNVGGKPYWSWYGFSSRVEWCCCFVSWCANECGYIESGTIPKYSVVDDGVVWFKNKDQWLDGSEEPEPGMIIFFDWADDGLDGGGDHTGIVEKVEGGTVYTIEGNSGDKVCENQYSIGNKEILGYGFYSGNNTVATGDTAQQT